MPWMEEAERLTKPGALQSTARTQTTCDPASTGELTNEEDRPSRIATPEQAPASQAPADGLQGWAINDYVACELSREVLAKATTLPSRTAAGTGDWASDVPEAAVSTRGQETPVRQRDVSCELLVSREMADEFAKSLMEEIGGSGLDRPGAESVSSFGAPEGATSDLRGSMATIEEGEALRSIFEKVMRDVAQDLPEGCLPACGAQRKSRPVQSSAGRVCRGAEAELGLPRQQDDAAGAARPLSECSIHSFQPSQSGDDRHFCSEVSDELWQEICGHLEQTVLQRVPGRACGGAEAQPCTT